MTETYKEFIQRMEDSLLSAQILLQTDRKIRTEDLDHVFSGTPIYQIDTSQEFQRTLQETVPIYQNPDIKRPSSDSYEILRNYRSHTEQYKKLIFVHFNKLPEWLRGFTDADRRMDINEHDYEPYDVMAHETNHILNPNKPEYWIRAYSPRGLRTFDDFKRRFPQFDFIIIR